MAQDMPSDCRSTQTNDDLYQIVNSVPCVLKIYYRTITHTLSYGASTKAAVIRIGLLEMWHFIRLYFNGKDMHTLLESCGVADLIATCSGGRNRRVSEAFVRTGKVNSE